MTPRGWTPVGTYTARRGDVTAAAWDMCAWCWGQGRIWTMGPGGMRPDTCPHCLGIGSRPRETT